MCRFLFAYLRRTLFYVVCSLFQQATSWLPNTLLVSLSLAYSFSLRLVVSSTAFCWAQFTSLTLPSLAQYYLLCQR